MPSIAPANPAFAISLVEWQQTHGRHDMPWQHTRDPYRVWLSEIMLQQTQVQTVLGYYERFLSRFPTVGDLAAADLQEVLTMWAGLGYYSRARNLHRCAQMVTANWGGEFPKTADELQQLPGIGPSTASAVAAFCFAERVAIFDGNVQRVLARYSGFDGDLAASAHSKCLKAFAHESLPVQQLENMMPRYTQGIMDLGATVCTPHHPKCDACPMATSCVANIKGLQADLPVKTRKLKRKTLLWHWLIARRPDGAVWLSRRPDAGIWASMNCFPCFESREELMADVPIENLAQLVELEPIKHTLTHRDLQLVPLLTHVDLSWTPKLPEHSMGCWVLPNHAVQLGVPVPVARLMALLCSG